MGDSKNYIKKCEENDSTRALAVLLSKNKEGSKVKGRLSKEEILSALGNVLHFVENKPIVKKEKKDNIEEKVKENVNIYGSAEFWEKIVDNEDAQRMAEVMTKLNENEINKITETQEKLENVYQSNNDKSNYSYSEDEGDDYSRPFDIINKEKTKLLREDGKYE